VRLVLGRRLLPEPTPVLTVPVLPRYLSPSPKPYRRLESDKLVASIVSAFRLRAWLLGPSLQRFPIR